MQVLHGQRATADRRLAENPFRSQATEVGGADKAAPQPQTVQQPIFTSSKLPASPVNVLQHAMRDRLDQQLVVHCYVKTSSYILNLGKYLHETLRVKVAGALATNFDKRCTTDIKIDRDNWRSTNSRLWIWTAMHSIALTSNNGFVRLSRYGSISGPKKRTRQLTRSRGPLELRKQVVPVPIPYEFQ